MTPDREPRTAEEAMRKYDEHFFLLPRSVTPMERLIHKNGCELMQALSRLLPVGGAT